MPCESVSRPPHPPRINLLRVCGRHREQVAAVSCPDDQTYQALEVLQGEAPWGATATAATIMFESACAGTTSSCNVSVNWAALFNNLRFEYSV